MSLQEFLEEQSAKGPTSPADVIEVDSRQELNHQLNYYSRPIIPFDNPVGRKFFMENIRPALRYYCIKFGVEVPEWLEEETHFGHGNGSPEEMEMMFGVPKLDPSTWDEWIFEEIAQARDVEEQGEDEGVVES